MEIKKIVVAICLSIFMLSIMPVVHGQNLSGEGTGTSVEKLESDTYVISSENKLIKRVLPETPIDIFKNKFNMSKNDVSLYHSANNMTPVEEGNIATGMIMKYKESEDQYTILVIGDLDNDSIMGEVELNFLIRLCIRN